MNADEIIDGLEEISSILPHSLIPNAAIDLIEFLQAQLAKENRAEKAVKVLERIKRDINEQEKIYIHIADYFGRGIYIDEEGDAE